MKKLKDVLLSEGKSIDLKLKGEIMKFIDYLFVGVPGVNKESWAHWELMKELDRYCKNPEGEDWDDKYLTKGQTPEEKSKNREREMFGKAMSDPDDAWRDDYEG